VEVAHPKQNDDKTHEEALYQEEQNSQRILLRRLNRSAEELEQELKLRYLDELKSCMVLESPCAQWDAMSLRVLAPEMAADFCSRCRGTGLQDVTRALQYY
jgi:hypothetical protein